MFHEKLNEYFNLLHCSGKEFAARSGLSEATVSRYRSGARTPKPHSSDMKKICRAISAMAAKAGIPGITDPSVSQELNRLAEEALFDYEGLQTKLDMLCSVLSVNVADMAKSLKKGGYAVISGFIDDQVDWVVGEHEKQGLKLLKLYEKENWRVALLEK